MIPKIENIQESTMTDEKTFFKNIGIESLIFQDRIKGKLYSRPEDFVVREIGSNGKVSIIKKKENGARYNKRYIHATLIKRSTSTFEACSVFAEHNNLDYFRDISFFGLKDTEGLTSQSVCIRNNNNLRIKKAEFKNFFFTNFRDSNKKLVTRAHVGNCFTVKALGVNPSKKNIRFLNRFKEDSMKGLPNFYWSQRFGIDQNNHYWGKLLLKKEYERFVIEYLTYRKNPKLKSMIMKNLGDWNACIRIFSGVKGFDQEKQLIKNLIKNINMLAAIKEMNISSFFVHSYSSYLFNLSLSSFLKKEYKSVDLLKLGKKCNMDKLNQSLYEPILEKENVSINDFESCDFDIYSHPRPSLFYPASFEFYFQGKDLFLTFKLGIGQYASLLLDFIFKSNKKLC